MNDFKKKADALLERKTPKGDKVDGKLPEWATTEKPEVIQDMINDLEDYETRWDTWEQNFMSTIVEKMENERLLTKGQFEQLEKIHKKYLG